MLHHSLVLLLLSVSVSSSPQEPAQGDKSATQSQSATQPAPAKPPTPQAGSVSSSPQPPAQDDKSKTQSQPAPQPTPQAGVDRPATVVEANSDQATVRVQLRNIEPPLKDGDLEAGLLVVPNQSALQVRPLVSLGAISDSGKEPLVTLTVKGLVAFGEMTVPLLYKGRQIETLRFFKGGLVPKPVGDSGFVARQSNPFLLVLENVSTVRYTCVHARLRFDGQDQSIFVAEPPPSSKCLEDKSWTKFDVPQYAQVTLSSTPPDSWFVDPIGGLATSGKRKGVLTLRFPGSNGFVYEQNVPLEVDFKPGDRALLQSIAIVALPIVIGALLSIFLRISLPNLKRRRQVKNQLNEAAKATAAISTTTDSNLRVLLRVERLALKEILKSGWWFGPNDGEFTRRVEQALPGLRRRIDGVRRLDTAVIKRAVLMEQGIAPTRLEQMDELLDTLRESLKQDQLTDEDWVLFNQRLEAVQKLLREPTQTEREAIEAMLAGRWQVISDHFGVKPDGSIAVPATLQGLEDCFPDHSLLPGITDGEKDGSKWVKAIGAVRADLQLTALMRLWDFQFLMPATSQDPKWSNAKKELTGLLATPTTPNLLAAKILLRQLASGISKDDIVAAIKADMADMRWDPQQPGSAQKIRYDICFRREELNTAVAREFVKCHWRFEDQHDSMLVRGLRKLGLSRKEVGVGDTVKFSEDGWSVYHYFEPAVTKSSISVVFHDSLGSEIPLQPAQVVDRSDARNHGSGLSQRTIKIRPRRRKGQWAAFGLEAVQLAATVLVPLATLAATTASGAAVGHWWELIGIGFGADTLKNIIAGSSNTSTPGSGG